MFELGINSALRISDILRVKVTDVFTIFGVPRESFDIKERKTGKTGKISITPKVKETLLVFKEKFPEIIKGRDNYLFFAQKTFPLGSKPIGRIQAWKIISGICEEV